MKGNFVVENLLKPPITNNPKQSNHHYGSFFQWHQGEKLNFCFGPSTILTKLTLLTFWCQIKTPSCKMHWTLVFSQHPIPASPSIGVILINVVHFAAIRSILLCLSILRPFVENNIEYFVIVINVIIAVIACDNNWNIWTQSIYFCSNIWLFIALLTTPVIGWWLQIFWPSVGLFLGTLN